MDRLLNAVKRTAQAQNARLPETTDTTSALVGHLQSAQFTTPDAGAAGGGGALQLLPPGLQAASAQGAELDPSRRAAPQGAGGLNGSWLQELPAGLGGQASPAGQGGNLGQIAGGQRSGNPLSGQGPAGAQVGGQGALNGGQLGRLGREAQIDPAAEGALGADIQPPEGVGLLGGDLGDLIPGGGIGGGIGQGVPGAGGEGEGAEGGGFAGLMGNIVSGGAQKLIGGRAGALLGPALGAATTSGIEAKAAGGQAKEIGGAAGGAFGGVIGTDLGGRAGGAIGERIGVGSEVGTKVGSKLGGKAGTELGTRAGEAIGEAIGGRKRAQSEGAGDDDAHGELEEEQDDLPEDAEDAEDPEDASEEAEGEGEDDGAEGDGAGENPEGDDDSAEGEGDGAEGDGDGQRDQGDGAGGQGGGEREGGPAIGGPGVQGPAIDGPQGPQNAPGGQSREVADELEQTAEQLGSAHQIVEPKPMAVRYAGPALKPSQELLGLAGQNTGNYLDTGFSLSEDSQQLSEFSTDNASLIAAAGELRSYSEDEYQAQRPDPFKPEPYDFSSEDKLEKVQAVLAAVGDFTGKAADVVGVIALLTKVAGWILSVLLPPVGGALAAISSFATAAEIILNIISAVCAGINAGIDIYRLATTEDPQARLKFAARFADNVLTGVGRGVVAAIGVKDGGLKKGKDALGKMKQAGQSTLKGFSKGGKTALQGAQNGLKTASKGFVKGAKSVGEGVGKGLKSAGTGLKSAGKSVATGFGQGRALASSGLQSMRTGLRTGGAAGLRMAGMGAGRIGLGVGKASLGLLKGGAQLGYGVGKGSLQAGYGLLKGGAQAAKGVGQGIGQAAKGVGKGLREGFEGMREGGKVFDKSAQGSTIFSRFRDELYGASYKAGAAKTAAKGTEGSTFIGRTTARVLGTKNAERVMGSYKVIYELQDKHKKYNQARTRLPLLWGAMTGENSFNDLTQSIHKNPKAGEANKLPGFGTGTIKDAFGESIPKARRDGTKAKGSYLLRDRTHEDVQRALGDAYLQANRARRERALAGSRGHSLGRTSAAGTGARSAPTQNRQPGMPGRARGAAAPTLQPLSPIQQRTGSNVARMATIARQIEIYEGQIGGLQSEQRRYQSAHSRLGRLNSLPVPDQAQPASASALAQLDSDMAGLQAAREDTSHARGIFAKNLALHTERSEDAQALIEAAQAHRETLEQQQAEAQAEDGRIQEGIVSLEKGEQENEKASQEGEKGKGSAESTLSTVESTPLESQPEPAEEKTPWYRLDKHAANLAKKAWRATVGKAMAFIAERWAQLKQKLTQAIMEFVLGLVGGDELKQELAAASGKAEQNEADNTEAQDSMTESDQTLADQQADAEEAQSEAELTAQGYAELVVEADAVEQQLTERHEAAAGWHGEMTAYIAQFEGDFGPTFEGADEAQAGGWGQRDPSPTLDAIYAHMEELGAEYERLAAEAELEEEQEETLEDPGLTEEFEEQEHEDPGIDGPQLPGLDLNGPDVVQGDDTHEQDQQVEGPGGLSPQVREVLELIAESVAEIRQGVELKLQQVRDQLSGWHESLRSLGEDIDFSQIEAWAEAFFAEHMGDAQGLLSEVLAMVSRVLSGDLTAIPGLSEVTEQMEEVLGTASVLADRIRENVFGLYTSPGGLFQLPEVDLSDLGL